MIKLPNHKKADDSHGKQVLRKRPFGIIVVIALEVIIALLGLTFYGLLLYLGRSDVVLDPIFGVYNSLYNLQNWFNVIKLLATPILLVIAYGLWQYKRWAWVATMAYVGIGMGSQVWSYFYGTADYLTMLMYILIVFYLNQSDVQGIFAERSEKRDESWMT